MTESCFLVGTAISCLACTLTPHSPHSAPAQACSLSPSRLPSSLKPEDLCKCYSFCLEHSLFTCLSAFSTSIYPSDIRTNATSQRPLLTPLMEPDFSLYLSKPCAPLFHVACCHCHFPMSLNEHVTKTSSPQTGQCLCMFILILKPQDQGPGTKKTLRCFFD